jgi:hypothetical protein
VVNPEPPPGAGVPAYAGGPARRRRRRWPWVCAIVVVVLLGLLAVADRVIASMAESAVADRIAEQSPFRGTGVKPHVSINGFPFLAQAVAGKYDDIEVSGRGLTIDQVRGIDLDAHMHGVHVPLGRAIDRRVTSLPIDHLDAVATIPYAEAARRTGIDGLHLSADRGALHVSLVTSLPQIGEVTASADADVRASGNRVSYSVGQITVNGAPAAGALTPQLERMMNGTLTLPTLPYHLQVTAVKPTPSGMRATARADHIVVDTG